MEKKKIASVLGAGLGIGSIAAFAVFRTMCKVKVQDTDPVQEIAEKDSDTAMVEPKIGPKSRVERMFGDKANWQQNSQTAAPAPRDYNAEGYKGFLFIRCEECGKERRFFAKVPYTYWRCDCGHTTELRDLLPAYAECVKCGNPTIKYKTNSGKNELVIECKRCDAPIDLALNGRGTAYNTVKDETRQAH